MRLYGWNSSSWVIMYEVLQKYTPAATASTRWLVAAMASALVPGIAVAHQRFIPLQSTEIGQVSDLATPISCWDVRGIEMVELPNVTYFNYNGSGAIMRDKVMQSDCLSGCVANCSCKAAYFKLRMNDTNGTCFLQSQLFSLHKLQTTAPSLYNSRAFIKLNNITFAERVRPMKKTFGTGILVGIIIGTVSLLFSIALLIRMRTRRERVDGEHIEHLPGMPRKFITGDFSSKIGEGASGTVFEGKIEDENIVVKRLDSVGRRKEEFLIEVQTIGSIHHVNLVRMIGFCAEKNHRLLMDLDEKDGRPLDWSTRHKIVSDIARGLCYLHKGCKQRIVHLDIKPQNILLDDQFNAKISDFGVAKLVDKDRSRVMTRMRGTPGYMAPEWLTSTITEKADVYSFGVVVLEIICGRRNLDHSQPEEALHLMSLLQDSARNDKLLDMIDHRMDDMQLHSEDVMHMMHLAMWCL
uniref:non-specific serine/threonine protein kinase n=1 Tax=Oryza barthii TaxID=65489 RepID=A0A0D3GHQ2_9ORYZ